MNKDTAIKLIELLPSDFSSAHMAKFVVLAIIGALLIGILS